MERILWAMDVILACILVVAGARISRVWFDVNATRNQAKRLLGEIKRLHSEALIMPASMPKTFPAETQYVPLYELPAELQRTIARHFHTLERESNAMDGD